MKDGAERIRQRIIADAQSNAKVIEKEAAVEVERVLDEAKKQAAVSREQILIKARKEAEEQKRRIVGMSLLDTRKEKLAVKQNYIEAAFEEALKKLNASDDKTYFAILRDMIISSIDIGDETVILSQRDVARVPSGFWEEINQELKARGKKGGVSLAKETRDISGGFILQSAGVEINNSFLSLLSIQRDELEPKVASILFAEE